MQNKGHLHTHVHSSTAHNSQEVEAIPMSTHARVDEEKRGVHGEGGIFGLRKATPTKAVTHLVDNTRGR